MIDISITAIRCAGDRYMNHHERIEPVSTRLAPGRSLMRKWRMDRVPGERLALRDRAGSSMIKLRRIAGCGMAGIRAEGTGAGRSSRSTRDR